MKTSLERKILKQNGQFGCHSTRMNIFYNVMTLVLKKKKLKFSIDGGPHDCLLFRADEVPHSVHVTTELHDVTTYAYCVM